MSAAAAPSSPLPQVDAAIDAALAALKAAGCAGIVRCHRRSDWSARVRQGAIERVESSDSVGLGVTAYGPGGRIGGASGTELTPASARAVAAQAAELSAVGGADEWAGLPDPAECGLAGGDLSLIDAGYGEDDHERLARLAIEAERLAFAVDPRVTNSHRSGASAARSRSWIATTDGIRLERGGTRFGYHAVVVAQEANGERQTGSWGTSARARDGLRPAAEVGRIAGERAVREFGWKRIASAKMPVVLAPEIASQLLGMIAQAASGGAVYRGSTFLAGKLGAAIAAPSVTIVDRPLLRGELGSRPCDGEGVRSRDTTVIEAGRLASWLVDGYAARRLKHPYTGHEGGVSNLRLLPGTATADDLLREMGDGLLITDFHGHGVNLASGSVSKGVSGFRVEGGRIVHPVQEITVAGNLRDLLTGVRGIGNDPLPQSSVSSPSMLVDGFTVGGA